MKLASKATQMIDHIDQWYPANLTFEATLYAMSIKIAITPFAELYFSSNEWMAIDFCNFFQLNQYKPDKGGSQGNV